MPILTAPPLATAAAAGPAAGGAGRALEVVAGLSGDSRHEIIPGSGHVNIITEQARASAVAGHVIDLLEAP